MKYITLFMLICLFFTVRTNEEDNVPDCPQEEKACKDFEEKDGYNCCWGKGKAAAQEVSSCFPIKMADFEDRFDELEKTVSSDFSLDCSGKYLYVASLLLLFFVF